MYATGFDGDQIDLTDSERQRATSINEYFGVGMKWRDIARTADGWWNTDNHPKYIWTPGMASGAITHAFR